METWIYIIGSVCLLLVVTFVIFRLTDKYGKSSFDDIFFTETRILVFSNIYHSGGDGDAFSNCKITEIEPNTGIVLRRKVYLKYSKLSVLGEINGKIWMNDDRFCVFDPDTFDLIFEQSQIGEILPELNKVKVKNFYFNEVAKTFFFSAENGYNYAVNPESYEIYRSDIPQKEQIIRKNRRQKSTTEFGLKKITGTERCELTYNKIAIGNGNSFINPDFLRDTATNQIIDYPEQNCIPVIHYDSLNKLAKFSISQITTSGNVLWTITQEQLHVKHDIEYEHPARLVYLRYNKPYLFLVFEAKRHRIISINLENGAIVWNLKL